MLPMNILNGFHRLFLRCRNLFPLKKVENIMKHIFLNLKRFDIPPEFGGVNRIAPIAEWGSYIVKATQDSLRCYNTDEVEFVQYFPEAHVLNAKSALENNSPIQIGCQGVYRMNTAVGGNFGAFTTNRPASAMAAIGIKHTVIGHCEERNDKLGVLSAAGISDSNAVNKLLNEEVKLAVDSGMRVLFCIGEKDTELDRWDSVLREQLEVGLDGVDKSKVVIAYEPVWSIGPGKTPADKEYITKAAKLIKSIISGVDVVYGGGLKADNAEMLSSIEEIDGGLIALTRFSGEIGFYPDEYIEIIRKYLGK